MTGSRTLGLLAAAMLGTTAMTGMVVAQQTPPQLGAHGPRPDMPRTRDEATAAADRMFARLDTDRNGQVTQAEFDAVRQARHAKKGERAFARMDADRNGQLTQGEFTAAREARQQRREARGKGPRGGMGKRMFARTDTDRNGSISQAEHRTAALARFQRIDANNDGRIDDAELQAIRQKRMERRAGPGGMPARAIHEPHTGG